MKNLLEAGRLLLLDMAATLFFLALYLLTGNVALSVVLGAGTVTLLTHDPRFVMIKPSVIYVVVGVVMLKRGWINRYLPPIAIELVPDIAVIFGYVWSGLMFFSATLNVIVAVNFDVVTWSVAMAIYGIVSKAALFLIGYATMRIVGGRRYRRQHLHEVADAPLRAVA